MIVSDLNYLESVENNNIEGAGKARFDFTTDVDVKAQRIARGYSYADLDIYADKYKTINFDQAVGVVAHV